MKARKILMTVSVCLFALGTVSCLKEQEDYFGQTASSRMQDALDNARAALFSSENGWRMEYYTDMGGYNYAVKFVEEDAAGNPVDSVVATSELAPRTMAGSFFRLTNDDGPVLSFDVYNELLHYFATPDQSNYQARGGDFEFIILSASPQEIVLKGKRSGNLTILTPIEEPETMESYAAKMALASDDFLAVSGTGVADDTPVKAELDLTNRTIVLTAKDDLGQWDDINAVTAPYLITEDGIKFQKPLEFKGHKIAYFTFNKSSRRLLADDEDLVFKMDPIPADYTYFSAYPGEYVFKYKTQSGSVSADVTVEVVDELSKIVQVKGFSKDYEGIHLWYNASSGRLQFLPQYVGVYNDEFLIAAFALDSKGSVSTSDTMDLVPDGTTGFKFVSTPDKKMKVTGYVLFKEFEDEEGSSDYDQFELWSPSVCYPVSLTRK